MLAKKNIVTPAAALLGSGAMAAFLTWAFSQAGTLGLYRWGYRTQVLTLVALGSLPLALLGARAAVGRAAPKAVLGGLCVAFSVVSLIAALGVAAYVFSQAYGAPAEAPRPALIDPAGGIPLRSPADGRPLLRVALSSDPHYGREASNAAARSAILRLSQTEYDQGRLDAFFLLGDTVEMGMEADDWEEALAGLHRDAPTLPFLALLGNHDAMVGGQARWAAAFGAGSGRGGVPLGALSASSWRADASPVHFIALDLLWGPEGFGAKERAWLSVQLESIPDDHYVVVLSHCFFYSSGYVDEHTGKAWYDHADMLREVAPLIAGKADLVVSGHNHYMEWIEADGTAWAVVGAMGGKPDPEPSYRSPGSAWFARDVYGRLVLELRPEGLACEFQDQDGKELFSRLISK